MTTIGLAPKSEMALHIPAMSVDINTNGDILDGWLMSRMDISGAIMVKEVAQGCVVAVRVDRMTSLCPVVAGDVVCCYIHYVKRGNISVTINIEVWVKKVSSEPIGQCYKVTEVLFIYIAVGNQGKLRALPAG